MIYLIKYWKPAAVVLLLLLSVASFRLIQHTAYKQGYNDATAKISADLAKAQNKQAAEVLAQERKQAAAFAEKQTEIEKEKQYAETVITDLRRELGRLQQHAVHQSRPRNLPATNQAACAPDETATKGWELFGASAARYAELAEVADKQRNDLAEWQAYGKAVAAD